MEIKISEEGKALLKEMASEILCDKNRLAKAIAAHVRNGIENFHCKYLSDDNMREINPRIRNAIYTFLMDFNRDVIEISADCDIHSCINYVAKNTYCYLINVGISNELISEFDEAVFNRLYECLYDISNGDMFMVELDMLRVPKYWEDCVYVESLTNK